MKVSVFGGSQPKEGSRAYAKAMELGRLLAERGHAALALPGGPGTLTEISLAWNLMIIGALHRRPLILIGDGWQTVFDQVYRSFDEYIPATQRETGLAMAESHRG